MIALQGEPVAAQQLGLGDERHTLGVDPGAHAVQGLPAADDALRAWYSTCCGAVREHPGIVHDAIVRGFSGLEERHPVATVRQRLYVGYWGACYPAGP